MNLLKEMDLAYCDLCGNYVPTVEVEGDLLCAYEYAEYPDMANVVGQRVSGSCQSVGIPNERKTNERNIRRNGQCC